MKIYLKSLASGCTSSLHEVSQYRSTLTKLNYTVTNRIDEADVIILNTCGFSTDAEENSLNEIDLVAKKYPQKKIIAGGCLLKINPTLFKQHHNKSSFHPEKINEILSELEDPRGNSNVDISSDVQHLHHDDLKLLGVKFKLFYFTQKYFYSFIKKTHLSNAYLDHYFKSIAINKDSVIIVAARGCLGHCTYCAIKKSRGTLQSTPWEIIKPQIQKAILNNKTDIILRAEDLGAWGQDIKSNICFLLKNILTHFPQVTITIPFFEPSWIITFKHELIPLLANPQFICFYTPLHSASSKVLNKMGRSYSSTEVIKIIRHIKKINPTLILKTNILHSFPTEDRKDFIESLKLAWSFDFTLPILFTPRPGTLAFNFPTSITPTERKIRHILASLFLWPLNLMKLITNYGLYAFRK